LVFLYGGTEAGAGSLAVFPLPSRSSFLRPRKDKVQNPGALLLPASLSPTEINVPKRLFLGSCS
jgi:hypothetical protein